MLDDEVSEGPIGAALRRRRAAQEALAGAVEELERTIVDGAARFEGEARRALLRHLYWECREIRVAVLQRAFQVSGTVASAAGHGPVRGRCAGCGIELRPTSRTDTLQRQRCGPCEQRHQEEWWAEHERRSRQADQLERAEADWQAAHGIDPWDDPWYGGDPPLCEPPPEEEGPPPDRGP